MVENIFHHALKVDIDKCVGCSHCMMVCPTHAIRLKQGKATIHANKCIDCGECLKACPHDAIFVEQDDFNMIFNYKYRVALFPSILFGQFPENITGMQIYSVLMQLGFTHVYGMEHSAEILNKFTTEYIADNNDSKPFISGFCPAVVRLIQVKFPSLVDNIIRLKPPIDLSTAYYKKQLMDKGAKEEEIGIFYITPCAAKIAAVKSPVGEEKSPVDGVINMDLIYNKIFRSIRNDSPEKLPLALNKPLTPMGLKWCLTGGEAENKEGRCLAIDGVKNVIEFLEKIENDELTGIDFLELRACDESCAGGVLTSGNRFLTVERLSNRAKHYKKFCKDVEWVDDEYSIENYQEFLHDRRSLEKIKPRSMMKLDENMSEAMIKMKKINSIMSMLPQADCGACGAPNCRSLAEDIVHGEARLSNCIFVQKKMEQQNRMCVEDVVNIMENVWGKDKFDIKKNYHQKK